MQYLVTGCGISTICETQSAVLYWVNEILTKGGVPQVAIYKDYEQEVA